MINNFSFLLKEVQISEIITPSDLNNKEIISKRIINNPSFENADLKSKEAPTNENNNISKKFHNELYLMFISLALFLSYLKSNIPNTITPSKEEILI